MASPVPARAEEGGQGKNRILGITADADKTQPTINIQTKDPVGYRYTVYDSFDPIRVVIDYPNMDVAGVGQVVAVNLPGVQEVRISSHELATGQLGRVEILLEKPAGYNVHLSGTSFRVTFSGAPAKPAVQETALAKPQIAAPVAAAPAGAATAASVVKSVDVEPGRATLFTDGILEDFKFFSLSAPPRLVVDLFGVKPGFAERAFSSANGFSQIRVGTYDNRTRFVFDAQGDQLPRHDVLQQDSAVQVTWEGTGAPISPAPRPAGTSVSVEAVDFQVRGGRSVFTVTLSGPAQVTETVARGDIVRFGVKNASISRALRRIIDPSAFPSSVRMITPYTVQEKGGQEVRFAVELKGPVPYSLQQEGNNLVFWVDNGAFAEVSPAPLSTVTVPVAPAVAAGVAPAIPGVTAARPIVPAAAPVAPRLEPEAVAIPKAVYTGQKISLVFDDADIRKILQLIAEVSELNIIVSDEVKGTITLRLIDVPWDQALDLVMDIKDLGMLREGNVVRVLPKGKIREMEEARFTAARTKEKLEDLSTKVISVSYSDLANVAAPSRELLTERGKITEDKRNKQLIITDVPAAVGEVVKLVKILDTPERQVMIEARIVEASSTFSRDVGVKWGISSGKTDADPNFNVGLGGSFLISPPAAGAVGAAGLGSGITFGQVGIDSTVLDLRISALESAGQGKVISTPRVSTLNGGEAKISQGTKIPYVSSDGDSVKTEFVDANLELNVKPVINPDNSIILDIEATNSSIGTNVSVGVGSAPSIDTKEAKTKVLVRDGETTVIGGIFVESENSSDAGVPWLMEIPILGHLFKSRNDSNQRSELLIFITPRIVQ
ncbi:type IV pilus modification protein PilQ [Desulfuromonas versatilis]|uniref:Type IV pilus modification protein PilQ n=1 Tax=Desulfuromonas versatilis TaxID=2802975 RepID=A0ABN6DX27_9BACT|nr:type IV pilus secretin family protein [Desulfuromonas versatilis]BCR04683.1 type IV pilus modification protein PilQ [Desulfuromonas versatilis]